MSMSLAYQKAAVRLLLPLLLLLLELFKQASKRNKQSTTKANILVHIVPLQSIAFWLCNSEVCDCAHIHPIMVGLKDYEDQWYVREAEGLSTCGKWRRGRKYLFNLDHKFNQMDFEKRVIAERKLRNYLKETDFNRNQSNLLERIYWNHTFPNMGNYRELHMHNRIVL